MGLKLASVGPTNSLLSLSPARTICLLLLLLFGGVYFLLLSTLGVHSRTVFILYTHTLYVDVNIILVFYVNMIHIVLESVMEWK
jgi:hypothetical protein